MIDILVNAAAINVGIFNAVKIALKIAAAKKGVGCIGDLKEILSWCEVQKESPGRVLRCKRQQINSQSY